MNTVRAGTRTATFNTFTEFDSGHDNPTGLAADCGSLTFRLRVVGACNGGKLLALSRRLVVLNIPPSPEATGQQACAGHWVSDPVPSAPPHRWLTGAR